MNPIGRAVRAAYRHVLRRWRRLRHITLPIALEHRRLRGYTSVIGSVVPGAVDHSLGRYAIFVIFPQDDRLDPSVERALAALVRAGVDTAVVSNVGLSPAMVDQLRPLAWRIVQRANVGFDFGAYKDAVEYLGRERPDLERLLILNDSVFYASRGLDDYVRELLGPEDVVAAFENWGEGYHLQSFGLSVSGSVFRSAVFQAYWKAYVPVSNRIHAIQAGEKRLSDAALRAAASSRVVYSASALYDRLREAPAEDRADTRILPKPYREALAATAGPTFSIAEQARSLVDFVNTTSPIHSGAHLFPKYLGCPIYKKDLVYRQRFEFWDLDDLLKEVLDPAELEEFMLAIRRKGDHRRLSKADLAKYLVGVK